MKLEGVQEAYVLHPDNVGQFRRSLGASVAVIARPDDHIKRTNARQIVVETERGVHLRCYLSEYEGIPFIVVYGRFDKVRSPSHEIDFARTQDALTMLGVRTIIGTFVVGAISDNDYAGTVVIPDDFIGLGGYSDDSWSTRPEGFRNVEMFRPFCPEARRILTEQAHIVDGPVHTEGRYISFHGWPRIETHAELEFYAKIGGRIVGQTLDPEATLARQSGAHYAALTVMMDDHRVRELFRNNYEEGSVQLGRNIIEGRIKTFDLFLAALPGLAALDHSRCGCDQHVKAKKQRSNHFYYRPPTYILD